MTFLRDFIAILPRPKLMFGGLAIGIVIMALIVAFMLMGKAVGWGQ